MMESLDKNTNFPNLCRPVIIKQDKKFWAKISDLPLELLETCFARFYSNYMENNDY